MRNIKSKKGITGVDIVFAIVVVTITITIAIMYTYHINNMGIQLYKKEKRAEFVQSVEAKLKTLPREKMIQLSNQGHEVFEGSSDTGEKYKVVVHDIDFADNRFSFIIDNVKYSIWTGKY